MKNSLLITVVSIGLLTLGGCGLKYIAHNDDIQRYVGSNIEEVISVWGAPEATVKLPTGKTAYTFTTEKTSMERTGSVESGDRWSNKDSSVDVYSNVKKVCKISVVADPKGKIASLSSKGDCDGRWTK